MSQNEQTKPTKAQVLSVLRRTLRDVESTMPDMEAMAKRGLTYAERQTILAAAKDSDDAFKAACLREAIQIVEQTLKS